MSVVPKVPKPFLMSDEMLKREFASALYHNSGNVPKRQRFLEDGYDSKTHILGVLKPLWVLLRIVGVFPVAWKEDKFSFSLLSPAFAYSVTIYILLGIYSAALLIRQISLMTETSQSFNTLIFSYLCILYSFPQTLLPVIHWFEARGVSVYLNDWTDLQRCVEQITHRPFTCTKSRNMVIYSAILIPIETAIVVLFEYILLDAILFTETPFYVYSISSVHFHCATWHFLCSALTETSDHLIDRLEKEFQSKNTNLAAVVVKYRAAWCQLSRLTCATGDVLVHTVAFILILWSSVLLLTIYGSMPGGVAQDYPVSREIGLAADVLLVFAVPYVVCNSAHQTTKSVGKTFLDRLSFLHSADKTTQSELDQFLKALTLKAPVINLGGYVDVNRALLTSLFSSLATYLIVLVQFKMSNTTQAPCPSCSVIEIS